MTEDNLRRAVGARRGQEGQPAPLYRASWSTVYCVLHYQNPVGNSV